MTQIIEDIITRMESGHILNKKGDRYSPGTLTNFRNTLPWLLRYSQKGRDFSDPEFFTDFQVFLITQGLAKNTVANLLENLHAILRHEKAFSLPKLESVKGELTTAVYIDLQELEYLAGINLAETPGYDRVRDAFVLHCNIGLRFGDFRKVMSSINRYISRHQEREYFRIKTGKAQEDVVIPINKAAKMILNKRNYDFGDLFSLAYYNAGIKWIGQRAGFTDPICKYMTRGGRMTEEFKEKWQMMSSHTARRSFATNAWLEKVPESDIMKITGHRSVSAFRRYLRADALQKARSLADHPFFN